MRDKLPPYVADGQRTATSDEGQEHKLTSGEWQTLVEGLGRTPTFFELGVVGALWSEHCSYKSSKPFLAQFLVEGKQVLQGPGENAGVVEITEGWAVAFKMESHNHPSFLEPYQGAATGVGGIMRDVFTMGARPVASLNALRFGDWRDPAVRTKTRSLLHGVVAGIGDYGNCMGVPTVGGETWFHPSYNGNNLVNAFTLGLLPSDRIFRGYATGVGNPVMYVGSKTGRDGIHGASMASDSFSGDGPDQRPTVQVGDPFQEKKLLEACLELMDSDCIIGIQDMGAAGLTSSAFEMADRAGTGIRLDLDRVPTREPHMTPYELMLSESQERMLVVLRQGSEHIAREIFARWDLDVALIGQVISGTDVQLCWQGQELTRIPVELAVSGFADPQRPQQAGKQRAPIEPAAVDNWQSFLEAWMASPNQASKRWIWQQYDSTVQGATLGIQGGEAAVISPPEIWPVGIAMTTDCPSRYVGADPYNGGRHTVYQALRNLACVGAEPLAMTDCLNFGNPENPEVYHQFAEAIRGVADAGKALEIPVVSGNVSLYNETDGISVLPTPEIGLVGRVDDVRKQPRRPHSGDRILLAGWHLPVWGASEYAVSLSVHPAGDLPELDAGREQRVAQLVRQLINNRTALDAKDIGSGGLLTGLLQLLFRNGCTGAACTTSGSADTLYWLGETGAAYLLVLPAEQVDAAIAAGDEQGIPIGVLAQIQNDRLTGTDLNIDLQPVYRAWHDGLRSFAEAHG